MDPYIDGVVPTPLTPEEKGFALGMLIGNLRRIHAAYDDEGEDLSALPAKAADEIEKLLDRLAKDGDAAAKDAERYRLLRRGQHWSVVDGIGDTLRADALDAAIDAVTEDTSNAEITGG